MVTGKDLINLGYKPDKWFSNTLIEINKQGLVGDEMIKFIESQLPPPLIEPLDAPISYSKNIVADNEEELENLKQVLETMDELLKTPTVIDACIMPDACPTGVIGQIPVGGVVVTKNTIHPSMHSADICCSVMMTNFGYIEPKLVLDMANSITHFGSGGRKDNFDLPEDLKSKILNNEYLNDEKSLSLAISNLGTQGDGNHFLFVGKSEKTGETIMVTHHGSRGFGANLYKKGKRIAEMFRTKLSPKTSKLNAWIPFDTKEGKIYWEALQITREWTKLNHNLIHQKTCDGLGISPIKRFWNEHNFVFKDDDNNFYHAKGATPLDDKFVPDSVDGLRLVPLNMSEPVLIVKGKTTKTNLGFAPHGAGRNISRTSHINKFNGRSVEDIFNEETKGLDVRFFSGKIDISELPSAYKNAENVQSQMEKFGLGEIVDRILPYGSIMAGNFEKNYKKKNR